MEARNYVTDLEEQVKTLKIRNFLLEKLADGLKEEMMINIGRDIETKRLNKAIENSPIILKSVTYRGQTLKFSKKVRFDVKVDYTLEDEKVYLVVDDPYLSIECMAETREKLVDELNEQIHFMYATYVCGDKDKMVNAAQELADIWRPLIAEVVSKEASVGSEVLEAFEKDD